MLDGDWSSDVCSSDLGARALAGTQESVIALGGGCAMNATLAAQLHANLAAMGIELREAHLAPPNDGGLSLGQAWVARRQLEVER
jgi:hydrogenase maturation protein HypF